MAGSIADIACTKPKDHGLAAELWTISGLVRFVSERAESAGFPRLAHAGKSTVWRILDENEIKPHITSDLAGVVCQPSRMASSFIKIRYYLEKRDPDFDRKMQEVLLVYRDVSIAACGAVHDRQPEPIYLTK